MKCLAIAVAAVAAIIVGLVLIAQYIFPGDDDDNWPSGFANV